MSQEQWWPLQGEGTLLLCQCCYSKVFLAKKKKKKAIILSQPFYISHLYNVLNNNPPGAESGHRTLRSLVWKKVDYQHAVRL